MYDMRFYLQAIIDYFSSCKPELGITDVHWSDDDPNGIAVITKNGLITISGECFSGLGGEPVSDSKDDFDIRPVKFVDLVQSEKAERLDAYLQINGWQLQRWDRKTALPIPDIKDKFGKQVICEEQPGYQIFFGKGIQVDNHYEYQFPFLLDECELLDAIDRWQIDNIEKYARIIDHNTEPEEEMERCPECGGEISPEDGEDDGYGELHHYWECEHCGAQGYAKIDTHNDNAFIGHEVEVGVSDYRAYADVDGYVCVGIKAANEEFAKKVASNRISEMDFGELCDINWRVSSAEKEG